MERGATPSQSGLTMLPLMLGLIGASTVSGLLVSRTGLFKPILMTGQVIMLIGVFLLTLIHPGMSLWDLAWRMLILGIGLGPAQSLFGLAVQNAVSPREIGVATSTSQFFRQIGATIGVAVFGTLLTNNLASAARSAPPVAGHMRAMSLADLEKVAVSRAAGQKPGAAPSALDQASQTIITTAMRSVFGVGLVVLFGGVGMTLLIPGVKLRGRGPQETVAEATEEALQNASPTAPAGH